MDHGAAVSVVNENDKTTVVLGLVLSGFAVKTRASA